MYIRKTRVCCFNFHGFEINLNFADNIICGGWELSIFKQSSVSFTSVHLCQSY